MIHRNIDVDNVDYICTTNDDIVIVEKNDIVMYFSNITIHELIWNKMLNVKDKLNLLL